MRILLDECVPRGLRQYLADHEVATVQELLWSGLKNGALLRRAADEGFAALITVDRGIEFQQSIAGSALSVIALRARSNDINDLRPLMSQVLVALLDLPAGRFLRIPE